MHVYEIPHLVGSGWPMRILELGVAMAILSELFAIRTHEVDEMIKQRMEKRTLYGQEFNLSAP
jgi:hypothetical protein